MIIREIEKTHAPRKNKEINPLRKSAQGLGVFLKGLSETVHSTKKRKNDDGDTLQNNYSGASRTFKLKSGSSEKDDLQSSPPLPFKFNFNDEQTFVLNLLKEMRKLAADASQNILSMDERNNSAARFQTAFQELGEKYPETFASLQKEEEEKETNRAEEAKEERLSISTHQEAANTFLNIEDMIVKMFEIGAQQQSGQSTAKNVKPQLSDHQTALNASGHIKELFMNEGGAKTFGRFQEIDRTNVLGMLK